MGTQRCSDADKGIFDEEQHPAPSHGGEKSVASSLCESEISDSTSGPKRFIGCYLLVSQSPIHSSWGRTYVGFTVNPSRRIKQHNGIVKTGGPKRTSRHRPWKMVALVHGFASTTQGLQFEWAWQNPEKCLSLQLHFDHPDSLPLPTKRSSVGGRLKSVAALLSVAPWKYCPLTLTILAPQEQWDTYGIRRVQFPTKTLRTEFRQLEEFAGFSVYDYRQRCDAAMPKCLPEPDSGCPVCNFQVRDVRDLERTNGYLKKLTHCAFCGVIVHVACIASQRACCDENGAAKLIVPYVSCPLCKHEMSWSQIVRLARALQSDED